MEPKDDHMSHLGKTLKKSTTIRQGNHLLCSLGVALQWTTMAMNW